MERPLLATTQWYPFLNYPAQQDGLDRGAGFQFAGDLIIIGHYGYVLSIADIARDVQGRGACIHHNNVAISNQCRNAKKAAWYNTTGLMM